MSEPTDVLVVGGGPVGVAMALAAARRGLTARVLERSPDVHHLPRAVVMDDEVQRFFQGLELSDGLAARTTPILGAEFVDAGGNRIMGFDVAEPVVGPLGHHPVVAYDQPELETWLRAEAVTAGVDLRLGIEVRGVGQDDDGAWADMDGGRVAGRWVVAADGAASPTRKRLGISFDDQGYDQEWLVVDLEVLDPRLRLPPFVQQVCDPDRPVTYVPGHGRNRRWEFQLQDGDAAARTCEAGAVWDLLEPWVRPGQADLRRAVVYRFHATVAERFRSGRVFLAGDAAHQMPPFLGQGLCAGLRDVANLTWKLAAVAEGRARDCLLDTYDLERRPHAAGVVAHAVEAGRLIDQLAGRVDGQADQGAGYGGDRPFPQLVDGVLWGADPQVGRQLPQPWRGADDALGDGWAVLTRTGSAGGALGARAVASDLAGPAGGIVVRPDRYVAAVAETDEDLRRALADLSCWFEAGVPA